jgi:hypothetical protein
MATLIRSPQGVLGTGAITRLRQQHGESVCGLRMAPLIRAPQRIVRTIQVALPEQADPEPERRSALVLIVTVLISLAGQQLS